MRSFIKQHYEKAKQRGWLPYFAAAAVRYDFPLPLLMAIASRETNMSNIKGDYRISKHFPKHPGYHGYGIMQVDIGTDAAWIASGAWERVDESIMHGTKILKSKADELNRMWEGGRTLAEFLWTLAASYNHGTVDSYHDFKTIGNPDHDTTGHDYGRDVIGRMAEFKQLLDADGVTATSYAIKAVASLPAPVQAPPSVTEPAPVGTVIQTGENNTVDNGAPQPVAGGGAADPTLILSGTTPDPKPWYQRFGAQILGVLTMFGVGLTDLWTGAKEAFTSNPTPLILGVIIIGVIGAIVWKIEDNRHDAREKDKDRAHERDMANLSALQDPKKVNVALVPAEQAATFAETSTYKAMLTTAGA